MRVSTTEFRANLSEYLSRVVYEDIIITNRGLEVARLISSKKSKKESLKKLVNIIPSISDEEVDKKNK